LFVNALLRGFSFVFFVFFVVQSFFFLDL